VPVAIVVMQIANVLLCRSATESMWRLPHRTNGLILAGIVFEVVTILAIDYVPGSRRVRDRRRAARRLGHQRGGRRAHASPGGEPEGARAH
jgi:hypothetical protein